MKMKLIGLLACFALLLAGCSLKEDAKDTASYAKEASHYLNKAAGFLKEVPEKADKAVNDENAREELKGNLEEMRQEIDEFGKVKAPKIASGMHKEILENNEVLKAKIDKYIEQIQNGNFNEEFLKKEDFGKAKKDFNNLVKKVKELGKE